MELQTVYPFRLPKGYLDAEGTLHREGRMRLATAGDELGALRDPRVKAEESCLKAVVLSKVVVSLGTLPAVTPRNHRGAVHLRYGIPAEYVRHHQQVRKAPDPGHLPPLRPSVHPCPEFRGGCVKEPSPEAFSNRHQYVPQNRTGLRIILVSPVFYFMDGLYGRLLSSDQLYNLSYKSLLGLP